MTQNQKIVLLLGAAGIVAYLLWKGSKKTTTSTASSEDDCLAQYEKALAGAREAAKTGAVTGVPPKEIFLQQCEAQKLNVSKIMCPQGMMFCPDDAGCFDPSKNPISDWESGLPHPCNRKLTIGLNLKDTRPV